MDMLYKGLIYLLAILLCSTGCKTTNVTVPQKQITQKEETHVYVDQFDPYPFVGSVNYEGGRLIGSAVLISPTLLLTAAHVSEDKGQLIYVESDGDSYCVEEVIYHPEHVMGVLKHDIAILVLESPSDEIPVEMVNSNIDAIYKGLNLITVGYGTGLKRYSIYGIFWYYGRLMRKPQFMIMLPLEGSIWFGDSGGAVITPNKKLIGIMSYFSTTRKGKVYENGCASIEYYKDWIEEVKNERTLERMVR